jgi:hypothetical protein
MDGRSSARLCGAAACEPKKAVKLDAASLAALGAGAPNEGDGARLSTFADGTGRFSLDFDAFG